MTRPYFSFTTCRKHLHIWTKFNVWTQFVSMANCPTWKNTLTNLKKYTLNMKDEMLEVVNENDVVIDLKSRKEVHQKGLSHREIHIWFMTPAREIIFQHRAKDKDTYPD